MGVMAKAADEGYRLIVVLSGITDNLRSQTQERIEGVLLGDHPERWYLLTSLDHDFSVSGNAANLLNDPAKRLVAVVKEKRPPFATAKGLDLVGWIRSRQRSTHHDHR